MKPYCVTADDPSLLSPRQPMPQLLPYLDAAAALPEFKADVLAFVQGGSTASRIELDGYAPRVKIERVLTQLLHAHPDLPVERVRVRGRSGCSDFSGEVTVFAMEAEHRFAFTWCCAWRAEQEGWRDCFGFWDQSRAAREFGWQCFSRWESLSPVTTA
jgi:hypothetical protein